MSDNDLIERKMGEIIKKDTVIWERPEALDEGLNPLTLLQLTMLDDIQVALTKLNEHFKKEEFLGRVDPRTLNVTDQIQPLAILLDWPFRPWISAAAHNYGPDTAYLSVNLNYDWIPLQINEDHLFDFKSSEDRIYLVYYKCDLGKTARVQINGKF